MRQVDMSAKAVTARLRRISQLRRLALSLRKAKLLPAADQNRKEIPIVERAAKPTPKG